VYCIVVYLSQFDINYVIFDFYKFFENDVQLNQKF